MQRLASGALVDQAARASEVWLDGGHDADGGALVSAAALAISGAVPRPLVVIVGMMANKDAGGFLANFAGLTRHGRRGSIPGQDNAMPPDRLADAARQLGMRLEIAASIEAAVGSLARLLYEGAGAGPDHGVAVSKRPSAVGERGSAAIGYGSSKSRCALRRLPGSMEIISRLRPWYQYARARHRRDRRFSATEVGRNARKTIDMPEMSRA